MRKPLFIFLLIGISIIESYTSGYITTYQTIPNTLGSTIYGSDGSYGTVTNNTLGSTIYWSNGSYGTVTNNTLGSTIYIQGSNNSNIYFNRLLDEYQTLIDRYNTQYKNKLDDECSENVIYFIDRAQEACYDSTSSACGVAVSSARTVIDVGLSNPYMSDSICGFTLKLGDKRLSIIESSLNLTGTGSQSCAYGKYFNTYLQKCLERPDYHKGITNGYKGSDGKAYCNVGYIWNMDLANCVDESVYGNMRYNSNTTTNTNTCPINSSLADDGTCYCDPGYKNNSSDDGCIVDKKYCTNNYGSHISNGKNDNGDFSCVCDSGYYFDTTKNKCLSVSDYCKDLMGNNSKRYFDKLQYSCSCADGYFLNKYGMCNEDKELEKSISWMYDKGFTKFNDPINFMYQNGLRRDEATKFFVKYAKEIMSLEPDKTKVDCNFIDLNEARPDLKDLIKEACQLGLFQGYKGRFMPTKQLTNAEAIAVFIRLIDGRKNEKGSYWADEYYDVALNLGLLDNLDLGYKGNSDSFTTRGDVGKMLFRGKDK